jgi:hypothetical protein
VPEMAAMVDIQVDREQISEVYGVSPSSDHEDESD